MAGNPMRYINGYLLEDDDGLTLIDCGWKADDVLAALETGLELCGHSVRDVRRLLITHFHFDHYGLAGTLVAAGVPELGMHARDWAFLRARRERRGESDSIVNAWLGRNGFAVGPDDGEDSPYDRFDYVEPTRMVEDGERSAGDRVDELLAHEATREHDVLHALDDGPKTATEVAGALRWRRRGDRIK